MSQTRCAPNSSKKAGFKAVFLSGYAASAALLGTPGLLTMTEIVESARRIAGAADIPVLADGDNGHGNATNVIRTIKEFEKAGGGSNILRGSGLAETLRTYPEAACAEMEAKIKAAVDARSDLDRLMMARTDTLVVNGMDDAIERVDRYRRRERICRSWSLRHRSTT